ncbi:thioredoxin (plasmid) [Lactiplantibacillus plantarum subsp. plantarum]|jgi:thioredoxin 1|uniref:thioredoxin n=1 Tax=Lactiplantibacillus TaxID=2767842 RepID=UPI00047F40E9|nr:MULTISPECIES: thioredoxin [Lactiplantibacillus]ARW37081.1 Thioredoxin [Lactiplantibacillus plantarum]ASI64992.1 thioredoxin [Lactiplantibacillus plantarum subsp. plantarum]KAE9506220.1 Thioredoxin [Lactiplantibacillus plantarum]KAF1281776.1 thioredoxin [Lactiplantibacillus plantarum]MBP5840804.1 thioredoxin [Lactiplantibacillus plantarum]
MIKNVTDQDFKKETNTGVTLTDFWATWCPPCRMQGPIIEELDKDMGDKVKISKMDVDANQNTPAEFGIMSIPTLIIKKDGKIMEKLVGLHSKDQLKQVLSQYID